MIPGFVIAYRDKSNKIILYFYPGYDDHNDKIYADIDMSKINASYQTSANKDGSVKYIFDNENITSITCKLVENIDGSEHIETFNNL